VSLLVAILLSLERDHVSRFPREVDDYFEWAVHKLERCEEDGGNPCSSSFLFAEVGTEGHRFSE
jgi:hypothetical protein